MNIDWVNETLLHPLMVLLILIGVAVTILCRARIGKMDKGFSKLFGGLILFVWIGYNVYNFIPSRFEVAESLPLHVCDLLALVSVLTLWTGSRKASTFLYFCAIPLAGQAIATPTVEPNPWSLHFWLFWLLHASIIWASVYDLAVRKYRPRFRDYLVVLLCDLAYIMVLLPINIIFDFNYGFIGNSSPGVPTMVDVFGPWPIRVLWMFVAVALVQFVMYLPWIKKGE